MSDVSTVLSSPQDVRRAIEPESLEDAALTADSQARAIHEISETMGKQQNQQLAGIRAQLDADVKAKKLSPADRDRTYAQIAASMGAGSMPLMQNDSAQLQEALASLTAGLSNPAQKAQFVADFLDHYDLKARETVLANGQRVTEYTADPDPDGVKSGILVPTAIISSEIKSR